MFYSRQLLARKAPLGQIWRAATLNGKITRKKLVKLNIIKICEEILNPSVPMALRLSGILMGGVVIVYERKVKLLYDDVNRLLVELNQAWKVNTVSDPTVLPKGKSQAKYEAITLPENRDEDLGEAEQSFQYADATTMMGFTQTAYFAMRLDNIEDPYINQNPQEDPTQDHHQVNVDDITLFERFDPTVADTSMFNRYERFDIEGDEDTQLNFATEEQTTIPTTIIPSPPPPEKPHEGDQILGQHPEDQVNEHASTDQIVLQRNQFRQGVTRRRTRRPAAIAMDDEQTIVPGHMYQSWLQDTSDITSRRRNKKQLDAMSKRKIADFMELPPTILVDGSYTYGNREVHFPAPLLELWRKSTQPCNNLQPSFTSPPAGTYDQDPLQFPVEDFHADVGSVPVGVPTEKLRTTPYNNIVQSEALTTELKTNTANTKTQKSEPKELSFSKTNPMATPGNSGDDVISIPGSGSGHGFLSHNSEANSTRSNKKRPNSPSRNRSNGLEPVAEENSWQHPDPNFKLARLHESELMVETGPTQTQKHPLTSQPVDPITHSIKMQLKAHFETSGSPKVESLNQLASGLNRKSAATLFFQTCVLATQDSIRVQQKEPYGDILISKGPKM